MNISAKDVMRLRQETDAPMMDCKKALVEAEGDFERAKELLREKGQAAAAKKAGRSTSEGVAFVVLSDDGKKAGGVVVECETDFVAKNEDFINLVKDLAASVLDSASPAAGETVELGADDTVAGVTLADHAAKAVSTIRENIQIRKAVVAAAADGSKFAAYNHTNTNKKAAVVAMSGDASNLDEVGFQVAIQVVAFPPAFLNREGVPQDVIAKEIEIEVQRAVNEGKPEEIARKIAQGRVNKEYYQAQVLLEQPFYTEAKKTVSAWVKENASGSAEINDYIEFAVGQGSEED
jgi:elongation factor Ts